MGVGKWTKYAGKTAHEYQYVGHGLICKLPCDLFTAFTSGGPSTLATISLNLL